MMSYDERVVFDLYIKNGDKCAQKGNYEFAIVRYTDAYNIAKTAKDSAQQYALDRINSYKKYTEKSSGGMSK